MTERNYVERSKIGEEALFDLDGLYKVMYAFFERYGYDWMEKDYHESKKGDNRKINILWWVERKVDDYTKFSMEISFNINAKEIAVKKERRYDGNIGISFDAFLENDYEENWSKSAGFRFFREVYDRFIIRGHFSRLEGDLKDEVHALVNEIKSFLRMHKRPEEKK